MVDATTLEKLTEEQQEIFREITTEINLEIASCKLKPGRSAFIKIKLPMLKTREDPIAPHIENEYSVNGSQAEARYNQELKHQELYLIYRA